MTFLNPRSICYDKELLIFLFDLELGYVDIIRLEKNIPVDNHERERKDYALCPGGPKQVLRMIIIH